MFNSETGESCLDLCKQQETNALKWLFTSLNPDLTQALFEAMQCHFHKASTSAALSRKKGFVRIKEKYWEPLSTLFSGSVGFPQLESALFSFFKKKAL